MAGNTDEQEGAAVRAARLESRIERGLKVRKSSLEWLANHRRDKATAKWRKFLPGTKPETVNSESAGGETTVDAAAEGEAKSQSETTDGVDGEGDREMDPANADAGNTVPPPPPPPFDAGSGSAPPPPVEEKKTPPPQLNLAAAYCGWLIHRGELYARTSGVEGTPMPPREVIEAMVFPAAQRLELRAAEWMGLQKIDSVYVDAFVAGAPGAWTVIYSGFKAIEKKRAANRRPAPSTAPSNGEQKAAAEPPKEPTHDQASPPARRLNPSVLE